MRIFALRTSAISSIARSVGAAVAIVIVTAAPNAAASAAAAATLVSIPLPLCCPVSEIASPDGLLVISSDGAQGELVRINPTTNKIVARAELPMSPPGGNSGDVADIAYADGSVWVAQYFEDLVYRFSPTTLRVQAKIATGLSPENIVFGGGRLWIPQDNGRSVAAINPDTNSIVRVIPVGTQSDSTDGPLKVAWNGTELLASLPGSGRVAHVSGTTYRVSYDAVGMAQASCAAIVPVPGGYWLDDTDCGNSYYHWNTSTRAITASIISHTPTYGAAYYRGALFTGTATACGDDGCADGVIVKHDAVTGREVARQTFVTATFLPQIDYASIWTVDYDHSMLQRSPLF